MITCTVFDRYENQDVHLYTLENNFVKVGVLDFGGIINFIKLKTPQGEKNIVLGYPAVKGYLNHSTSYCGATVGRVANRIENGVFSLGGKTYELSHNDGAHCLHGGEIGFDRRLFSARTEGESLVLSLESKDLDMGFPGNLHFEAKFTLCGKELFIEYSGESDRDTLFSPTCHIYLHLEDDVNATLLQLNAESITPVNGQLIATGKIESVKGTAYDFTSFKSIGEGLSRLNGKTFDINYVLNGNYIGEAKSSAGDISVKVTCDMPGVQLYVGECKSERGEGGGKGFCLEPQYFPNAINVEGFQSPLLHAHKKTTHTVHYQFEF